MRAVCDACEGAPARVFCAADEAALCPMCDKKVHGCNKLASRHIRLTLAEESAIRRCDICEKSAAFFFCAVDGTSLCLQCDMEVHVGGKRTHQRYLLMGQQVELPIPHREEPDFPKLPITEPNVLQRDQLRVPEKPDDSPLQEGSNTSAIAIAIGNTSSQMIDLNFKPHNEPSCINMTWAKRKVLDNSLDVMLSCIKCWELCLLELYEPNNLMQRHNLLLLSFLNIMFMCLDSLCVQLFHNLAKVTRDLDRFISFL